MATNMIDQHIGLKIKLRRSALGITQNELGKILGVTFQQVQKYEKGANKIGSGKLYEIAEVLDSPIEYFYEGLDKNAAKKARLADSAKPDYNIDKSIPDKEVISLLKFFSRIENKQTRESVIKLAKSLSNVKNK